MCPHLPHDLSKAHGLINARDGSCQVRQEGGIAVVHAASCQPSVLRVGIHLLYN